MAFHGGCRDGILIGKFLDATVPCSPERSGKPFRVQHVMFSAVTDLVVEFQSLEPGLEIFLSLGGNSRTNKFWVLTIRNPPLLNLMLSAYSCLDCVICFQNPLMYEQHLKNSLA
jgi:hypothetical protein